ncbi:MAG: hypothetical protein WD135_06790 [Ferruginibacter sp.]
MAINSLYKNIFNKDLEDPGNPAFLQQVTKEHPYFSLAHFFQLKNTDEKNKDYPAIAAITALHFNNPFLLNAQLQYSSEDEEIILQQIEPIIEPLINVDEMIAEKEKEESFSTDYGVEPNAAFSSSHSALLTNEHELEFVLAPEELVIEEVRVEEAEQSSNETSPEIHIPLPTMETADIIAFEPLHATDYFASQGIKLSQEILPNDKLGKQLKSFTEWLKTMKKVHEAAPLQNDQVDSYVQHMAENSNKNVEVVTETMAEVFIQQGKINKAKEIYVKLSLLNPPKSAYFAAKLENLK